MHRDSLPKLLTIGGTLAVFFGLLIPVLEFYLLLDIFIWIIALGSILGSLGLVMLSLRFGRLRRLVIGSCLLSVGGLASLVAVSNVHIWGLFLFLAAPMLLLGAVLVLMMFLPPGRTHVGCNPTS